MRDLVTAAVNSSKARVSNNIITASISAASAVLRARDSHDLFAERVAPLRDVDIDTFELAYDLKADEGDEKDNEEDSDLLLIIGEKESKEDEDLSA